MAQVTVYLPDDVLQHARRIAKRKHTSLSSFIADLLQREMSPSRWPEGFVDLLTNGTGDLVEPEDTPPEDVTLE